MNAPRPRSQINGLAIAAIAGVALFAVLVALIPVIKDGYSPVEDAISNAAVGSYGYLQTIAFFALGLGSLTLAQGLWRALEGRSARIGSALIGLWGLGIVLAGVFPADLTPEPETTSGTIHIVVSLLGFVAVIVGMLVLSAVFRKRPTWHSLWPTSSVVGVAALIAFLVTGATQDSDWWGVAQRVFVALVLLWLLLAATRLRAMARRAG